MKNGIIYEGEFFEGLKDGKGMMREPDGCKFEGTWRNNEMDGVMKFTDHNGKEMEIEFF